MKLYWIKAQAPRRVLALVKHLGLEVDTIQADPRTGGLRSAEYLALNPNGKAPTLVDGDHVLWESSAIMAYLCDRAGSDMWPGRDPREQFEVLRWLSWNDCHWAPAVGPFYFEYVVKSTFGLGPPEAAPLGAATPELHRYARVLDARLEGRSFVACDRLTIADFQLASMATDWQEAKMPLEAYRNIVGWLERLNAMPAWRDPWPAAH